MNKIYMKEAIKEANKALNIDEIPVGCVIVFNDEIIGRGHNLKEREHSALFHAEIIAIQQACKKIGDWRLNECVMYCTMEPCIMCMGAIVESRIQTIVCGIENNKSGFINDLICKNNNIEIQRNVCKDEIVLMFNSFFEKIRNN